MLSDYVPSAVRLQFSNIRTSYNEDGGRRVSRRRAQCQEKANAQKAVSSLYLDLLANVSSRQLLRTYVANCEPTFRRSSVEIRYKYISTRRLVTFQRLIIHRGNER